MGDGNGYGSGEKYGAGSGTGTKNKNEEWLGNLDGAGVNSKSVVEIFDNQVWLNSEDAAVYLRRSVGQLRNMVYRRQIKPKKYVGRLYFRRSDLDRSIESSNKRGF